MSINLTATTHSLEIVTTAALSTHVVCSYTDVNGTAQTPGSQVAQPNTATTTTIVSAPGASVQRLVHDIEVINTASGNQTVTVQKDVGGTDSVLVRTIVLAQGERLHYTSDTGWRYMDTLGQVKSSPQTLSNDVWFTSTTTGPGAQNAFNVSGTAKFAAPIWITSTTSGPGDEHSLQTSGSFKAAGSVWAAGNMHVSGTLFAPNAKFGGYLFLTGTTYRTAGTFSHTYNSGTRAVEVEMVGGGGGSGGVNQGTTNQGISTGGGASGEYRKMFFTVNTSGTTLIVGAAGGGGSAGANNGTQGGTTRFFTPTGGASGRACTGGLASAGAASSATALTFLSGAAGTSNPTMTIDDVWTLGSQMGEDGYVVSTTLSIGGDGAGSFFGPGPEGKPSLGGPKAGTNGVAPGAGASGACSAGSGTATRAGGSGAAGMVIVKEFG